MGEFTFFTTDMMTGLYIGGFFGTMFGGCVVAMVLVFFPERRREEER